MEKDDENFDKLQELWRLLLTGKYAVTELAERGRTMEITKVYKYERHDSYRRTPTPGAYRSMFSNRYYAGEVEVEVEGGKQWKLGKHAPMVSAKEFEEAQAILQKHGYKHAEYKPSYDNILKNILFCGHTGEPAYLDVKKRYTCGKCKARSSKKDLKACPACNHAFLKKDAFKVEHRRYYSFTKGAPHTYTYDGETKTTKNIPVEYIESLVEAELARISISDGMFQILRRLLYTEWLEKNEQAKRRRSMLRKKIEETEEKLDNTLKEMYGTDAGKKEERANMERATEAYKTEIKATEQEVQELTEKLDEEFEKAWELMSSLLEAKDVFSRESEGSFEPKRRLLLSMVSNQKFLDGEIITEWKKPFDMLLAEGLTDTKKARGGGQRFEKSIWLPRLDSNQ